MPLDNIGKGQSTAPTTNFGSGIQAPGTGKGLSGAIDASTDTTTLNSIEDFISMIIGFMTVLAGLFFLFYAIMGGVNWITAGGDSGKIEKARNQIVQGVIGMVVIVSAYLVIGVVGSIIGIDILSPAEGLRNVFIL
jgi:hypothetical protein